MLKELCAQRGIGISAIDQITFGGQMVSSSRIRDLLGKGKMSAATGLLGRPWSVLESPDSLDGETSIDLSGYTKLKEGRYEVRIDGIVSRATLIKMEEGKQILALPKEWSPTSSNKVIVEFVS